MRTRVMLSLLLPFAAAGLQWLLWEYIQPYVWFLFFPAAYLSAWIGGLYGGLMGTALSALLVWFIFIPPHFSLYLERPADLFSILVFVFMGSLFAFFFERLRQARQRSELRFEATFEQAAVGMALVSIDGHFLQVNRKLAEIVGYNQEELMGVAFQEITHPEDLETDLAKVRHMQEGDLDTYTLEQRCLHKDSREIWVRLSVALVRREDRTPDYFIRVIEDIQARKEAEARLAEVRRLAQLGHWYWDLASDTHTWSKEIFQIYGRDPSLPPAVYPEVQSLFTPDSWTRLATEVEQALADGTPYACDAEVVRPDGSHRWIMARGQVLRDPAGSPVALYGTVQDITDRKLAELALAVSERRFRELIVNANSAIIHWAVDGTILYLNPFAQTFFGWSGNEVIGRPVTLLVPERESTGADLSQLVANIAAHPQRYASFINENICKDGRRVWVHWSNQALCDLAGQVTGILAIGNDITDRCLAEEELKRRNEELERFNRAAIDRELEMIRLKQEINRLLVDSGGKEAYDLSFLEEERSTARSGSA